MIIPELWKRRMLPALCLTALGFFALACSDEAELASPVAPEPGDPTIGAAALARATVPMKPRQILVRLAPGVSIDAINADYGTETIERLPARPVFLLRTPDGKTVFDCLAEMRGDTRLEVAEPNYELGNPEAQRRGSTMTFADPELGEAEYSDQQALSRIRAREAQALGKGSGVLVAILDTGIQSEHPVFAGRIASGGADFIDRDGNPADAADGVDSDGDGLVDEAVGHGTFVAGLVLSVAPRASILPVRVLDSDGFGTSWGLAKGIELAHRRGARVINMSLGMAIVSRVVDGLIERIHNEDVVFVASAGNDGVEQPQQFPARDSYVIGVAATDREDKKATFSNFGSWVDVSAPGVGLVGPFPEDGFARWRGTSFAAGLVSGEAALLFSVRPGARFREMVQAIEESAVSIDGLNPDFDGELGSGRIDVLAAARRIRE